MKIFTGKLRWFFGMLAALPLAGHAFMFDPDGPGGWTVPFGPNTGDTAVEADAFDVTQSSILSKDGIPAVADGKVQIYSHGLISAATNNGTPVWGVLSPGYACEITIVLGVDTVVTSVDGNTVETEYDPSAETLNFFEMWYDGTPCDNYSNALAGTGYNDGTLILSGKFTSLFNVFKVNDSTPPLPPLEGDNPDHWIPVETVVGEGNSNNVRVWVESFDPAFFTDLNAGDVIILALQNYSQEVPYTTTDPSESFTDGPGGDGVAGSLAPVIGDNEGNDGDAATNGVNGPDFINQTDVNLSLNATPVVQQGACRMTGGNATVVPAEGPDERRTWDYEFDEATEGAGPHGIRVTTGGQINAPSGLTPPAGHWEHTLHGGADGTFSFHAGTSSAPQGTEISDVQCADPGWCVNARCAPFKQLFWKGIGNFANQHFDYDFGGCPVTKGNRGTLHAVQVMIGDFGENDRPTREEGANLPDDNPDACDWQEKLADAGYEAFPGPYDAADAVLLDSVTDDKFGYRGGQVCDKCPDYYQIKIHCTTDLSSEVIYEFSGHLEGGNYQIHPETGEQCPATPTLAAELFSATGDTGDTGDTKTNNGKKPN